MKRFLCSARAVIMMSGNVLAADINSCAFTNENVGIYIPDKCELTVMVNEVSEGENVLKDDSIIYINTLEVEKGTENTYQVELPVASWYNKDKDYIVRIRSDKELYLFGDNDLDGNVTKEDAKAALLYALDNDENEDTLSFLLTDVTKDGYVNAADSAIILSHAVSK